MTRNILVVYASEGDSTAGVAEAIGQTLSVNGAHVDVLPFKSVTNLNQYQAVVCGSAVHSGKWMPEAMEFIERHQSAFRQIPTAVFQVCMMLASKNESYRRMVPGWLEPIRAKISPAAEGNFAGALWPDKYTKFSERLGLRIFLASVKLKAGDYRDWDAIHAWAENARGILIP